MTKDTAPAAPSRPAKAKPEAASRDNPEPPAAAAWAGGGEAVEAVVRSNGALASGMTAIGQEVMNFANRRFGENVARTESFMHCKDAEEAFSLSCDFAQKAATQYLEETSRILALANEVTRAYWEPLEEQTRRTLRDMNGDGK